MVSATSHPGTSKKSSLSTTSGSNPASLVHGDLGEALCNQPLVIDNGTGVIKAGFAGGDRPKVVFPSFVGRPKHVRMMPGGVMEGGEKFVGSIVEQHRGIFTINYPMEHGVVTDWNDMELIWRHIYSKEQMSVPSDEHPVLLTEAPLNPYSNREKAAEIFFEVFNAPALFVAPQAILSLYASGRTTGVVLDSGDGVTHCIPVYEGFAMPHAVSRLDVAGRDVTERLQLLLRRAGYPFHTSAEKEIVKSIKEDLCYVAFNPAKEEEMEEKRSLSKSSLTQSYKLPDGTVIQIGPERFRAPEILFQPDLIGLEDRGLQHCLCDSIMKSDLDLRKTLFANIVLAGGSTLFSGFGDRLLNEVRKVAAKDTKIRISAPPERKFSTWVGGSILASLATFKTMWVRKDEYEEHGASIINSNTL